VGLVIHGTASFQSYFATLGGVKMKWEKEEPQDVTRYRCSVGDASFAYGELPFFMMSFFGGKCERDDWPLEAVRLAREKLDAIERSIKK
jgi:hypothetical protein